MHLSERQLRRERISERPGRLKVREGLTERTPRLAVFAGLQARKQFRQARLTGRQIVTHREEIRVGAGFIIPGGEAFRQDFAIAAMLVGGTPSAKIGTDATMHITDGHPTHGWTQAALLGALGRRTTLFHGEITLP